NIAEALVSKGLATVIRYRQDDDQRSSHYDELLAAEARAIKNGKGLHSKKEVPIHRVADISGDKKVEENERRGSGKGMFRVLMWGKTGKPHAEACRRTPRKQSSSCPFFRAGRSEAVVEYVFSGSRLKLYLPKETCLITFLLAGSHNAIMLIKNSNR
ncbi:hypothetical protein STEG23_018405, partial [Scotinomys teguina]